MQKMRIRQIEKIVETAQALLRIQDWRIEIIPIDTDTVDDTGNLAKIWTNSYAELATMHVSTAREPNEIRESIWHEMSHLLLTDLRDTANDLASQISPTVRDFAKEQLDTAEERIAERLQTAFAKLTKEE